LRRYLPLAAVLMLLISLALAVFSTTQTASAATSYYVSPSGNDSNNGLSSGNPFRTIQKGFDVAQAGDTINLASGTYLQDFITKRSGSSSARITLTGPSTAIVKGAGAPRIFEINHSFITVNGFTIDGKAGSGGSASDYRDKLLYVQGKGTRSGPDDLRITNMTFKNGGGECLRLRYFVVNAEVAYNTFNTCGVHDFQFGAGGKNGEAIYIGTSNNQWADGKNPTADPDVSRDNRVHHNTFNTQGNECVDIKEGATANIVEDNQCTGQLDTESAGLDARGSGNTFRNNYTYGNKGAGVRLGGATVNGVTYGVNNNVYGNRIENNERGGIKIMVSPQGQICGNTMSGNAGGNVVGDYTNFNPTASCGGTNPTPTPTPGTSGNVALRKSVTYSSQQDTNPATNIVDGSTSTRWSAEGFPNWVRVDFGATYSVNKVEVAPYQSRAYKYKVEVSTDGTNWTQVVDRSNNTTGSSLLTDTFTARSARYARLTVLAPPSSYTGGWASINEFRVFGS
jgi:parallel beta-helix repeat protein